MVKNNLIFLDIDGTLLNSHKTQSVDNEVAKALKNRISILKRHGYLFGINSNRAVQDIVPIYKKFGLNGPIVAENGILVYTPKTKKTVYILNKSELNRIKQFNKIMLHKMVCLKLNDIILLNVDTVKELESKQNQHYKNGSILLLNNKFRKFTISCHIRKIQNGNLKIDPKISRSIFTHLKNDTSDGDFSINLSPFHNLLVYSNKTSKRRANLYLKTTFFKKYAFYAIGDEIGDYNMVKGIGKFMTINNAKNLVKLNAYRKSKYSYARGVLDLLNNMDIVV